MPYGVPLDDLEPGNKYEIHLLGKIHPLPCVFIQLLATAGQAAKLCLKPVRSLHPIRLSVKDIEAIQPINDKYLGDATNAESPSR
jgi:hypothetical protein